MARFAGGIFISDELLYGDLKEPELSSKDVKEDVKEDVMERVDEIKKERCTDAELIALAAIVNNETYAMHDTNAVRLQNGQATAYVDTCFMTDAAVALEKELRLRKVIK